VGEPRFLQDERAPRVTGQQRGQRDLQDENGATADCL
jgi:hypothetical protein